MGRVTIDQVRPACGPRTAEALCSRAGSGKGEEVVARLGAAEKLSV